MPSLDQQTPELSFSVLCKALPTLHLPQAQGPAETQLQQHHVRRTKPTCPEGHQVSPECCPSLACKGRGPAATQKSFLLETTVKQSKQDTGSSQLKELI